MNTLTDEQLKSEIDKHMLRLFEHIGNYRFQAIRIGKLVGINHFETYVIACIERSIDLSLDISEA